jgi:hypothetical protein
MHIVSARRIGFIAAALLILMTSRETLALAAKETRYGVAPDLTTYPQATAKQALSSLLKAVELKRVDYAVAQLADPSFVDDRVRRLYGGRFDEQVEDSRARLDPLTIKQLERFLKNGDWQEENDRAIVRLKDDKRCLYFKKDNGRWFMENASTPKS